jgi:hypothetical protein
MNELEPTRPSAGNSRRGFFEEDNKRPQTGVRQSPITLPLMVISSFSIGS